MLKFLDIVLSPLTYISARWLRFIRSNVINGRLNRMPLARKIFYALKVFPIIDHYYEPMFNPRHLRHPLTDRRNLPGINFNIEGQISFLKSLNYQEELLALPVEATPERKYFYKNGAFGGGDAECYYSIIRKLKPKRVIEIGSGNSTLVALEAIKKNISEDKNYKCELICIEPYEMKWLESFDITVIRKRVEDVELDFFEQLEANDILFIDSSHVIRPQGDVVMEFLTIIPTLKKGVLIHVHDILTPYDYAKEWVVDDVRMYNELYLLEGFLSFNDSFKIICGLAQMRIEASDVFHNAFPVIKKYPEFGASSFWMQRV